MSGYLYFPGCSLQSTGIAYDESMRELFRVLGMGLNELNDWNCCASTGIGNRSGYFFSRIASRFRLYITSVMWICCGQCTAHE